MRRLPPTRAGAATGAPVAAAPIDAPVARPAARVGAAGAIPAEPMLRRNAGRSAHTLNSTVSTLVTVREATGGVTPLHAYASASTAVSSPNGIPEAVVPARGVLGQTSRALRAAAGAAQPVEWLQARIRTLRAEALDGHPPKAGDAHVTAALTLRPGAEPNPVTQFWRQGVVEGRANLGPEHDALVAALDVISQAHGPHVGLGLSFALLSATRAPRGDDAPPVALALQAFHGNDPVARILASAEQNVPAPTNAIALKLLQKSALSNQFESLARAMAPELQPGHIRPLRRFLEAQAVIDSAHADPSMWRPTETAQRMAVRVRDAARQALQPDAAALNRQQVVDTFCWDNHFRDDAAGSDLAKLKQHFSKVVQSLAGEQPTGGLLSAAYEFGLSGADRHLLTDEAARLGALRDGTAIDATVDAIQATLQRHLATALQGPTVPTRPNLLPLTLARQMALADWSPANKGTLTVEEMVKGRVYPRDDDALRTRVAAFCEGLELGGDEESGPASVSPPDPETLHAQVQGELSLSGLGFEGLFRLAKQLEVPLDDASMRLAENSNTIIHGHTRKPGERTPQAVGAMLVSFLENIQFGNHARMSHLTSGSLSARGAGFNATSLQEGGALAELGPRQAGLALAPTINFAFERGREQVLRVGAATHGVEIFLGQSDEAVNAEGAGIGGGYPNDRSLPLRASAGVDVLYNGSRTSRLEGVMLRVDRQIVEDRDDGNGGRVFRQNDEAVRQTASHMARLVFERAPAARTDPQRETLLEDLIAQFHDQGLSMTLLKQKVGTHRTEANVGVGVSAALGLSHAGVRFGGSVGVGVQYAPSTNVSQRDTTGAYQVTVERRGWFSRMRLTGGASANVYLGAGGLPPVPIVRGQVLRDEAGGAVRVRIPTRAGNIVAEKTFSDTDTASPAFLKEIVLAKKDAWVDLFAFPHRGDADQGQAQGERALNEFFHSIDSVRAGNQRYYARERLHPDVGQRLDELASLAALAPSSLPEVRDEIAMQRHLLLSDDRSWGPASLIAYERNGVERGAAGGVGVQLRHVMASEGEREFIFHTPGWAQLRARERSDLGRPGSLDAIDERALPFSARAFSVASFFGRYGPAVDQASGRDDTRP